MKQLKQLKKMASETLEDYTDIYGLDSCNI